MNRMKISRGRKSSSKMNPDLACNNIFPGMPGTQDPRLPGLILDKPGHPFSGASPLYIWRIVVIMKYKFERLHKFRKCHSLQLHNDSFYFIIYVLIHFIFYPLINFMLNFLFFF